MSSYVITRSAVGVQGQRAIRLMLSFAKTAPNSQLVRDVEARMKELRAESLGGRPLVLLNGPASLPVLAVIVHHVDHLFGAVAVFDPKLDAYVVCITHDPRFAVGDTIAAADVIADTHGSDGEPH